MVLESGARCDECEAAAQGLGARLLRRVLDPLPHLIEVWYVTFIRAVVNIGAENPTVDPATRYPPGWTNPAGETEIEDTPLQVRVHQTLIIRCSDSNCRKPGKRSSFCTRRVSFATLVSLTSWPHS